MIRLYLLFNVFGCVDFEFQDVLLFWLNQDVLLLWFKLLTANEMYVVIQLYFSASIEYFNVNKGFCFGYVLRIYLVGLLLCH